MQQLHLIGFLMNMPKNHHILYFGCDPYLPHLSAFLQPKLRYLGLDEDMIPLEKSKQAYMLAALDMREAHSKQSEQKHDNEPHYKIGDLDVIRHSEKKSNWDAKYVPNSRVVHLIDSKWLEVSDPIDRIRKVNVCDAHRIVPSDHIVCSLPDNQVFGRRGKYINDPNILKRGSNYRCILTWKFSISQDQTKVI